ncbi:hypothetical protein DSUL_20557 [Desulfovibrionales bacterium]
MCIRDIYPKWSVESVGKRLQAYVKDDLKGEFAFQLVHLWQSWLEVMGPELGQLARPLGHRRATLKVGVVDAMAMYEVSFIREELVGRANAHLGKKWFDKVELHLLNNITPLDEVHGRRLSERLLPCRPERLGKLFFQLPKEHPVGQCYRAYVQCFERFKRRAERD